MGDNGSCKWIEDGVKDLESATSVVGQTSQAYCYTHSDNLR